MSGSGPKRAVVPTSPVPPETQNPHEPATVCSDQKTKNKKEELQPEELLLLREFFLLLDEWDRPNGLRKETT
jgi:hypothetical protein